MIESIAPSVSFISNPALQNPDGGNTVIAAAQFQTPCQFGNMLEGSFFSQKTPDLEIGIDPLLQSAKDFEN